MIARSVDDVLDLYARWGTHHYDESLSQVEHGLQCAARARHDNANDALVLAALLHDVGHLIDLDEGLGSNDSVDRSHEITGVEYLARLYPPEVTRPIALHVSAKRYLVAQESEYASRLSPGSTASLRRQGGPMTTDEMLRFEAMPGCEEAVRLRRWDEEGKVLDLDVGEMNDYRTLLDRLLM